jgi:hypothetical protein
VIMFQVTEWSLKNNNYIVKKYESILTTKLVDSSLKISEETQLLSCLLSLFRANLNNSKLANDIVHWLLPVGALLHFYRWSICINL